MTDKELIELLQKENRDLSNKLARYQVAEKGKQRELADIAELSTHDELKNKFFSIQSFGPCVEQEIATKLGHCVRTALFPKRTVKRMFKGEVREAQMVSRLTDLCDRQYDFYLLALKRIYQVLSETIKEQDSEN